MQLLPRHLSRPLQRAIAISRIVNVIGPRQDGKSTLVRDLLESDTYITLDNDAVRQALAEDPYGQLQALVNQASSGLPIVIDEIQRLPDLTLSLKRIVDKDQRRGQFVLTGSADIFTAGQAVDSLAGRVATLVLRPLSTAEIGRNGPSLILDAVAADPADPMRHLPPPLTATRADVIDRIVRGGFPELRLLDGRDRRDRYLGYLDSIVERDMAAIHKVRKPDAVRRLIVQAAARTGQELKPWSLANDLAIKFETLSVYLDALTRLGIVLRLGAWSPLKAGRDVKASKLHLMDTGLATALRGEDEMSFGLSADPGSLGALFETFVFTELEKSLPLQRQRWSLWHWRAGGREIDIIAEAPGRLLALFEMKASSSVDRQDFRHIDWFLADGPGRSYRGAGFVVYLGEHLLSFGQGRIALPASMLWSFPAA